MAYSGRVVRVIEGTGRGQERSIASNDVTTLTVAPSWSVVPDATSTFVIAESSWKFAAVSATSSVQFEVPFEAGTVVQVSGRGANVSNQEGDPDLCPLTRWRLGGEASNSGVPSAPRFTLNAPGAGEVTISDVTFDDPTNTASISAGTLQLYYWNELDTPTPYILAAPMDASGTTLQLNQIKSNPNPQTGDVIQVDSELMLINSVDPTAKTYNVTRGGFQSGASTHDAGVGVLHLSQSTIVLPFAAGFFGNRASINYLDTFSLPDARISAATLFVTNPFGNSPITQVRYVTASNPGLRTLSGGQFSLQVNGYLATQQNAAPPLVIETSHAVRDIRATVGQAPTGCSIGIDILQSGIEYCSLTIDSGSTASALVSGVNLAPLRESKLLTMNVTLNVSNPAAFSPGRDLTVTVRL